jgi:HlyD family secretion protein
LNFGTPKEQVALTVVKKRTPTKGIKTALLVLLIAAAGGYVFSYYFLPRVLEGFRITPVKVALEIAGPALIDARNKVTITARIQGFLKEVNVDRNDLVEPGQIVARLDSEDIVNQLNAAQADAEAAERTVSEASADLQRLRALAEKATWDYARKRELHEKAVVSESDWIAGEASYRQAQADLARGEATVARARAQAASAEANVKLLKVRLGDATMRSPLKGIVVSRDRNPGDLLLPGTPLIQLVDPTTIVLSTRFDESAMGTIAPGQHATVRFASIPNEIFNGTVLRVTHQVDQETREFTVDIIIEHLPDSWALGQRANAVIQAPSLVPTISIPQRLTERRNGRVGVWRVRSGRAEWAPIELGYPAGEAVQVVNGLNAGDILIPPEGIYEFEPIALRGTS